MTYQEALTKVENYKKKLKVLGTPCHFEFDVREAEEEEFVIVAKRMRFL